MPWPALLDGQPLLPARRSCSPSAARLCRFLHSPRGHESSAHMPEQGAQPLRLHEPRLVLPILATSQARTRNDSPTGNLPRSSARRSAATHHLEGPRIQGYLFAAETGRHDWDVVPGQCDAGTHAVVQRVWPSLYRDDERWHFRHPLGGRDRQATASGIRCPSSWLHSGFPAYCASGRGYPVVPTTPGEQANPRGWQGSHVPGMMSSLG